MPHESELVLVTGASGYLGAHVTKILLDNGYRVRGTVRSLKNEKKVAPLKILAGNKQNRLQLVEADLLKPNTWNDAVDGCTYVMHMASPFSLQEPKNEDEVIRPAVEGTLTVLNACATSGTVKRVVLTSSIAAITGDYMKKGKYDENDWTDTNTLVSTYIKSKTMAEEAAWKFVKEQNPPFELATVNPGLVLGPLLHDSRGSSVQIMSRILNHEIPMLSKMSLGVVDIRNVAEGHLKAMTMKEAAGKRHLLVNRVVWIKEIANILAAEFGPQGYNVPLKEAPYLILKVRSFFDPSLQAVVADYGKKFNVDNSRMVEVLGINPIDLNKTVIDMAHSLIERGFVKKTALYKSPRKWTKSKL